MHISPPPCVTLTAITAVVSALSGYLVRVAVDRRTERDVTQPIGLQPETIAAARALARRVVNDAS